MKLIFYGQLRELYGESVEIKTDTVADAIEGASRQLPDWPRDLVIEVVDFDDEVKLTSPTDVQEVHLVPAMFGGGGRFLSTVLIGAAMIGLAFALPGIGVALSATMKTAFIVAGAATIISGVVGLLMPAPSISKSEDPAASKYLGNNKNTADVGTPITIAGGTINLFGHWLSIQSDSNNLVFGRFPNNPT